MPRIRKESIRGYDPNESVEERTERLSKFDRRHSSFIDPQVMHNLNVGEDTFAEFEDTWRGYWEDDVAAYRAEGRDHKELGNFSQYMAGKAYAVNKQWNDLSRTDIEENGQVRQKTPEELAQHQDFLTQIEGQGIDMRRDSIMLNEINARNQRMNQLAHDADRNRRSDRRGAVGNALVGAFKGGREWAKGITFGLADLDNINMSLGSAVGADDWVERYRQGLNIEREALDDSLIAQFGEGAGALIGFVQSFGSMQALAGKAVAKDAGKAIADGTKRKLWNNHFAAAMGHVPQGAGMGYKTLASAGQFLTHTAASEWGNALTQGLHAEIQGTGGFGETVQQNLTDVGQRFGSALSGGAALPWLQKGAAWANRTLMGTAKGSDVRFAALNTALKDAGELNLRGRAHSYFARTASGGIEFLGFGAVPHLNSKEGNWGVHSDLMDMFSSDEEVSDQAFINMGFHLANGMMLKGMPRGKKPGETVAGVPLAKADVQERQKRQAGDREARVRHGVQDSLAGYLEQEQAKGPKIKGMTGASARAFKRALKLAWEAQSPAEKEKVKSDLLVTIMATEAAAGAAMQATENPDRYRGADGQPIETWADPSRYGALGKAMMATAKKGIDDLKARKKAGEELTPEETLILLRNDAEIARLAQTRQAAKYRESKSEESYISMERAAERVRKLDNELDRHMAENFQESKKQIDKERVGEIEKLPPGDKGRPLVPGKSAEAIAAKDIAETPDAEFEGQIAKPGQAKDHLTFPAGFAAKVRGKPAQVQVDTTSDGQPVWRDVRIQEARVGEGKVYAVDAEGNNFIFGPKEVLSGHVRGELFDTLAERMPSGEIKSGRTPKGDAATAALQLEHDAIVSRGDTIGEKPDKPYIDPVLGSASSASVNEALKALRGKASPKLEPAAMTATEKFLQDKVKELRGEGDLAYVEAQQLLEKLRDVQAEAQEKEKARFGSQRKKAAKKKEKAAKEAKAGKSKTPTPKSKTSEPKAKDAPKPKRTRAEAAQARGARILEEKKKLVAEIRESLPADKQMSEEGLLKKSKPALKKLLENVKKTAPAGKDAKADRVPSAEPIAPPSGASKEEVVKSEGERKTEEATDKVKVETQETERLDDTIPRVEAETSPARELKLDDKALAAAQKSAQNMGNTYVKAGEDALARMLKGRKKSDLNPNLREKINELEANLEAIRTLVKDVPSSKVFEFKSGGIMPEVRPGDILSIVYPTKAGNIPARTTGLIITDLESPKIGELKRGAGKRGQMVRKIRDKIARGGDITLRESKILRTSATIPGRRLKMLVDGEVIRIRKTDIASVQPREFDNATFGYDPDTLGTDSPARGVEVSEEVFMSWFESPDLKMDKKRVMSMERDAEDKKKGSGEKIIADLRMKSLLDNETEGYMRKTKGEVEEITPAEAAEIEARNLGAQIRKNAIHPDNAELRRRAVLALPGDRKTIKINVLNSKEKAVQQEQVNADMEYIVPGTKLRDYDSLTKGEKKLHDYWAGIRDKSIADRRNNVEQKEFSRRMVILDGNHGHGEYIVHFIPKEQESGKIARDGQILIAERTPEGTMWVRSVDSGELRSFLRRHGRESDIEKFLRDTREGAKFAKAEHNRRTAALRQEGTSQDMLKLLDEQFMMMYEGTRKEFPGETDLHERVRQWLKDNPEASERTFRAYLAQRAGAEHIVSGRQRTAEEGGANVAVTHMTGARKAKAEEGELKKKVMTGAKEGSKVETEFESRGPLEEARYRMTDLSQSPGGARLTFDEKTGNFKYKNQAESMNDYFKLWEAEKAGVKGEDLRLFMSMFGTGAMMTSGPMIRHILTRPGALAEIVGETGVVKKGMAALGGFNSIWGGAIDTLTAPIETLISSVITDRLHSALHETDSFDPHGGKKALLWAGENFGDSDSGSSMRKYLREYNGERYVMNKNLQEAVENIRAMTPEEQLKVMRDYEAGERTPGARKYGKAMDDITAGLLKAGIFDAETVKRFEKTWIHYGIWKWSEARIKGDLEKAHKVLEDLGGGLVENEATKNIIEHIQELEDALKRMKQGGEGKVFIASKPMPRIPRPGEKLKRLGITRERQHENLDDAIEAGLIVEEPWKLMALGMKIEGEALARANALEKMVNDPSIVLPAERAPKNWVLVVDPHYTSDPAYRKFRGKKVDPQALAKMDYLMPETSAVNRAVDSVMGLTKAAATVGQISGWSTQILGNQRILAAEGVPYFAIVGRMTKALWDLATNKEKREHYLRKGYVQAPADEYQDVYNALDGRNLQITSGKKGKKGKAPKAETYSPQTHMGQGFIESMTNVAKFGFKSIAAGSLATKKGRGLTRRAAANVTETMIKGFSMWDSISKMALHEYNVEARGMSEKEAEQTVDRAFDVFGLPKGQQFIRRYINSFHSIRANFTRNLPRWAPKAPGALLNLAAGQAIMRQVYQMLFGISDEEWDATLDASIPLGNSVYRERAKMTAQPVYSFGSGGLRFIDTQQYDPVLEALRSIPLTPLGSAVRGVDSYIHGKGFDTSTPEGLDFFQEMWFQANSNILLGPELDWAGDVNRFQPGRGIQKDYDRPGIFGTTGYVRYQIERGSIVTAALALAARGQKPTIRKMVALLSKEIPGIARDLDSATGGKLGTPVRYIGESRGEDMKIDPDSLTSRDFGLGDAFDRFIGNRYENADQIRRIIEILEKQEKMKGTVVETEFGLKARRELARGSAEKQGAKEVLKEIDLARGLVRGRLLMNLIRNYESGKSPASKKVIQQVVPDRRALQKILKSLHMREQFQTLNKIRNWLDTIEPDEWFVREESVRPERGPRFGTQRTK